MLRAWAPVILWMGIIYVGSTDLLSSAHTARWLAPVIHWLWPGATPSALRTFQFVVRKAGHLTEYDILAMVLWRALAEAALSRVWSWRRALVCFGGCVAYAITDEFHQSLMRTRQGSAIDVLIDATGAALGLGMVYGWLSRTRKRSEV